jgi:hypothetical protein
MTGDRKEARPINLVDEVEKVIRAVPDPAKAAALIVAMLGKSAGPAVQTMADRVRETNRRLAELHDAGIRSRESWEEQKRRESGGG